MSMLLIKQAGISSTLQDLGRPDAGRWGVPWGGAMDRVSHRLASLLVGNQPELATIEMTVLGDTIEFAAEALVAWVGADFSGVVNWEGAEQPLPLQRPVLLNRGARLRFSSAAVGGGRGYLAIAGGIEAPRILGSQSTLVRGGWGGWQGRSLRTGDRLNCGPLSELNLTVRQRLGSLGERPLVSVPWFFRPITPITNGKVELRVLRGRQFGELDPASQKRFFETFQVLPQSDRMGARLIGPLLGYARRLEEASSSGTVRGTVQLPQGAEQPLLLLADGAPTGGYPQVAHVIAADWPVAGQLAPGNQVRFVEVSRREAWAALHGLEQTFSQIGAAMRRWICSEF